MGAAEKDLVESVNPKMGGPQRGEGRKIAPGGARSLHFGRDDSKKERPRATLPVFFPGESRTSNGKCINLSVRREAPDMTGWKPVPRQKQIARDKSAFAELNFV